MARYDEQWEKEQARRNGNGVSEEMSEREDEDDSDSVISALEFGGEEDEYSNGAGVLDLDDMAEAIIHVCESKIAEATHAEDLENDSPYDADFRIDEETIGRRVQSELLLFHL